VLNGSGTKVTNNCAPEGAGVFVQGGTLVIENDADVCGNIAEVFGGGIFVADGGTVVVHGAGTTVGMMSDAGPNVVSNGDGGGIYAENATVIISNNARLECNSASGDGGGIYLTNSLLLMADGAAVGYPDDASTNYAGRDGGGIYAVCSAVMLTNSTLERCVAGGRGGGMCLDTASTATTMWCAIGDNRAVEGGGIALGSAASVVLTETPVQGNAGRDAGGGLFGAQASIELRGEETDIEDNYSHEGGGVMVSGGTYLQHEAADVHRNTATVFGGGIFLADGAQGVVCDAATFIGAAASGANVVTNGDGGGVYLEGASLVVSNGAAVASNEATGDGGGVCVTAGTLRVLESGQIGYENAASTNVAGGHGGGVCAYDSDVTIGRFAQVIRGRAVRDGGGIYIERGTLDVGPNAIVGSTDLNGNRCGLDGGGICAQDADVSIATAWIMYNLAFGDGGGIAMRGMSSMRITNLVDGYNTALDDGGGLFCLSESNVTATIDSSLFITNSALRGGAVHWSSPGPLVMRAGTDVQYNHAVQLGGGVYAEATGTVLLTDVKLSGNTANIHGGGLFSAAAPVVMTNCTVLDNRADADDDAVGDGGGLCLLRTVALLHGDITMRGNRAANGGGICADDAQLLIAGTTTSGPMPTVVFESNSTSGMTWSAGGAINLRGLLARLFVNGAALVSNEARQGAAVVADLGASGVLANVVIAHNSSPIGFGGVVVNASSHFDIVHCTVADNGPRGITVMPDSSAVMTNCIVWGHSTEEVSGGQTVNYSDVAGGYPGNGNLDVAPMFVNEALLDYQLMNGSPCINTGIAAGVLFDCLGVPRPVGGAVDLGAYEFVPEPAAGTVALIGWLVFLIRTGRGGK